MSEDTTRQRSPLISRRDSLKLIGGLFAAFAFPGLAQAGRLNQALPIQEGDIPDSERVTFEGAFANKDVEYLVKYLPSACAEYSGKLYQVTPQTIWWHWDGGVTPTTEDHDRVKSAWYTLVGRTRIGDPVAAHFSLGPKVILQMLPMSASRIIQGRLTDDSGIDDVNQAKSLGGVHLETTGCWYHSHPPIEAQTATLIDLTIAVMRQYSIPFPRIWGHRERAAWNPKPDPGVGYLAETRIRLLKTLIARCQWPLVGHPSTWNFYMETMRRGTVVRIPNQMKEEFWSRLTEQEEAAIQKYIIEAPAPIQHHGRYFPT
jgi:hypothetical protein